MVPLRTMFRFFCSSRGRGPMHQGKTLDKWHQYMSTNYSTSISHHIRYMPLFETTQQAFWNPSPSTLFPVFPELSVSLISENTCKNFCGSSAPWISNLPLIVKFGTPVTNFLFASMTSRSTSSPPAPLSIHSRTSFSSKPACTPRFTSVSLSVISSSFSKYALNNSSTTLVCTSSPFVFPS